MMKGQSMLKPGDNRSILKDQYYVIKVIDVGKVPPEVGAEALKEIEFMQSMSSTYIIGYFDSFIEKQLINIIMEYCPFGDLCSIITKQKALGKSFVDNIIWKVFINICLGVWYLHSENIIHRDLKTLNIFMITQSVAKIGDLGCSKKIGGEDHIK